MASLSSNARGTCSAGKVESPVADAEATGLDSTVTESSTVTDQDREGHELPNKVTELQTSGLVRWNVYESVLGYDRDAGKERWGEWVLVGSHKTELEAERQIRLRKEHNHAKNSDRDYGIVEMRWEKRHELVLPANSTVTQNALLSEDQEVGRLQSQVEELQNKLKIVTQELPIEAARLNTLNKLKLGRQSAAGKAIDAFIKELKRE